MSLENNSSQQRTPHLPSRAASSAEAHLPCLSQTCCKVNVLTCLLGVAIYCVFPPHWKLCVTHCIHSTLKQSTQHSAFVSHVLPTYAPSVNSPKASSYTWRNLDSEGINHFPKVHTCAHASRGARTVTFQPPSRILSGRGLLLPAAEQPSRGCSLQGSRDCGCSTGHTAVLSKCL